jgi:hypothetical protein
MRGGFLGVLSFYNIMAEGKSGFMDAIGEIGRAHV